MKRMLSILAASVAIAVFRTYVILTSVEQQTGFYITGAKAPLWFNAALIVMLAAVALVCFVWVRDRKVRTVVRPPKAAAIVTYAVVAAGFFVAAVAPLFHARTGPLGVTSWVTAVLALLSAFCFVLYIPSFATGKNPGGLCYFTIAPTAWAAFTLFVTFLNFTTVATISEYLLDTAALSFLVLFFYYDGVAKADLPNSNPLLATAFGATFFICASSVPKLICQLFFQERPIFVEPFGLQHLVLVALLPYLLTTVASVRRVPVEQPDEAEPEAPAGE